MNLFENIISGRVTEAYPTSNGFPLKWCKDLGIGFLPTLGYDYGQEYWERYNNYVDNGYGVKLSRFRKRFVLENFGEPDNLCDVGIGSGQFVETIKCKGFDINPYARKWLEEHGNFADPYVDDFSALTFWDVLEHIENPSHLLKKTEKVFLSIPIHRDVDACLASKHLRPDEHLWHFTEAGLEFFMSMFGFKLTAKSDEEIKIGREDIMTYSFSR